MEPSKVAKGGLLLQNLVFSADWEFLPGMLVRCVDGSSLRLTREVLETLNTQGMLPQLDDAATLGCLLVLASKSLGVRSIAPYGELLATAICLSGPKKEACRTAGKLSRAQQHFVFMDTLLAKQGTQAGG